VQTRYLLVSARSLQTAMWRCGVQNALFWSIIYSKMDQIQAADQIIRYDRKQTRAAYSAMNGGDADRCGCSCCLNFAAQRRTAFPDDFRRILDQLGIDPEKEGEAYECGPDGALRVYGGWFYFCWGARSTWRAHD
jgi:hypothetical protein